MLHSTLERVPIDTKTGTNFRFSGIEMGHVSTKVGIIIRQKFRSMWHIPVQKWGKNPPGNDADIKKSQTGPHLRDTGNGKN